MDVKVDALMLKRLFMEDPFFIFASLLIIIFALPAEAEPPAGHNLNVNYLDTYFRSQKGESLIW